MLTDLMEETRKVIIRTRQELYDKGFDIGMEQGFADGKQVGFANGQETAFATQRATILEMLGDRFNDVPARWRELIDKIDDAESLKILTRNIYKVASLDDFGRLLREKTGQ